MIKKLWLSVLCCQLLGSAMAQTTGKTDTIRAKNELQEVVVSGSKFNERNSKVAVAIKKINRDDLTRLNISNMANVIETSGLAFVQKSQQGGGSPVIRGFEASRVLLMVDGVRMNNAIYRSGHLQNIITVDPNILQNVEILYGPSSTLYGSDALGGIVNMFTINPTFSSDAGKSLTRLNAQVRYSSAIEEKMGHVDFNLGGNKWASFTSLTHSDFGDIKIGKRANKDYPGFGLQPFYVERVNGRDSSFVNPDAYKLKPTAYQQTDVLQKIMFKPNVNTSHLLNLQVSHSTDIPRFDRLTEVASSAPRFAEWYYGPQKRYLASYTFEKKNMNGFFEEIRGIASYQVIEESRYDRRFRQSLRNERIEKINVMALSVDGRRKMDKHELVLGAETQLNDLRSTARGYNVDNGSVSKITTRYPDGSNQMNYFAAYAQHIFKITDRLTLNDGLRINFVNLESNFIDTALLHFPFTTAAQKNTSLNGNVGLVYSSNDDFKIAGVFSTGFRAPNFDDLAKVFDTRAGAVVVPNRDLKPEYTYNAELNVVKYFPAAGRASGASLGASIFHTWFRNAIVVDRFRLNNNDSILYNGVRSAVLASQNKAEASLWGWNAFGNLYLTNSLQLTGTVTYTKGTYSNNNTKTPLDHIPPVYGKIGLRYTNALINGELYSLFNGWKHIEDYSPSGEDNQQYATPDGMPSWTTINARIKYNITNKFTAQVGLENIFDVRYRTFSSGFSAPGRNLILSLRASL